MSDNNNKQNNPNNKQKGTFNWGNIGIMVIALVFLFVLIFSLNGCQSQTEQITYDQALDYISTHSANIEKVSATPASDSSASGSYVFYIYLKDGSYEYYYVFVNGNSYTEMTDAVLNQNLTFDYVRGSTVSIWQILIYGFLAASAIFLIVLLFKSSKSNGNSMNQTMEFTKSRAKLNKMTTTTFKDVAGLDEEKEELKEIVDFLKNPKKYTDMGARVPKGVLLYGKPGTGKTLLARAVAGEAGVPFFFTTGSDLVEMFVGVGASRVRDMFKTAKKAAPSILFMDEIDAIGRQRGTGLGGGNDEREQTLNQLLVELDGFSQDTSVIVMAATNRPDILDPALLRPGRFDRQIDVSAPDVAGREAILKVHARGKKIANNVDFKQIAHQTPGFTGADLENVMNESALLAARQGAKEISPEMIDEAIDRVMMGPAKKSRVISKREKEIIAYHEAGHCVIGTLLSNADIVQKVTIIPRGEAGGYNLMGPKEEETYLRTKDQLMEQITGLLGGRTAEELMFGQVTTGASNDMVQATTIARSMVTEYGMSKLGPITYEQNSGYVFLGRDYASNKNFSDTVAHEIDEAVRDIINECHNNAAKVLNENIDKLKAVAHYLLVTETLLKPDIDEIMSTGKLKRVDDDVETLKSLGTSEPSSTQEEKPVSETATSSDTPQTEEAPKTSEDKKE